MIKYMGSLLNKFKKERTKKLLLYYPRNTRETGSASAYNEGSALASRKNVGIWGGENMFPREKVSTIDVSMGEEWWGRDNLGGRGKVPYRQSANSRRAN